MYVIEEKIKIFNLIKNLLKINGGGKSIFLYGNADFSGDIEKLIAEKDVLVFRYVNPAVFLNEHKQPDFKNELYGFFHSVDLAVLGECGNFKNDIDIAYMGNIKSILLNVDNAGSLKYPERYVQIITCGLKEKDTVIFSSINLDEGNVILDLQRSVKNIKNETVEPFEKQINIPCAIKKETVLVSERGKYAPFTAEDLLLALTALTLCGRLGALTDR